MFPISLGILAFKIFTLNTKNSVTKNIISEYFRRMPSLALFPPVVKDSTNLMQVR